MDEMNFESQLFSLAGRMEYPRTPDIAGEVMARIIRPIPKPRFIPRRLAWSLTIILILFSSLLLIPPARAAIVEFIQIGIVRIFPRAVVPTVVLPSIATSESFAPVTALPLTATSGTLLPSLLSRIESIAGETNLAKAQQIVEYAILLPTYPPELGQPDHVYVQDANGAMIILVWTAPQNPEHVTLSLHFIPNESWAISKFGPEVIERTDVDGQYAVWGEGPYPLFLRNGNLEVTGLIEGHVLIWAVDDITYRLETDLPLEEARKIAESLEPVP